jgi:hypothetical protein
MMLRMKNRMTIKSLRNHSMETLEALRSLLAVGAEARPDLSRRNFYELDGGDRVFYVFVSPATGKVTLLAVWDNARHSIAPRVIQSELAACCNPTA